MLLLIAPELIQIKGLSVLSSSHVYEHDTDCCTSRIRTVKGSRFQCCTSGHHPHPWIKSLSWPWFIFASDTLTYWWNHLWYRYMTRSLINSDWLHLQSLHLSVCLCSCWVVHQWIKFSSEFIDFIFKFWELLSEWSLLISVFFLHQCHFSSCSALPLSCLNLILKRFHSDRENDDEGWAAQQLIDWELSVRSLCITVMVSSYLPR